jgi:hypothetical protein
MPALSNSRHERVARLLSQGLTKVEAFKRVFPENKFPAGAASNLCNRIDVQTRLAEIREIIDSQFAMELGAKRDTLRRMIAGEIPTKVVRRTNGKLEAIFDRLAALNTDARLAGEFAPEQLTIDSGPTLKLEFNMIGRNTKLTPAMEAEWQELNREEPVPVALPDTPPGQQNDFTQYAEADIRPDRMVSLDSLKPIIDVSPENTD